MEKMKLLITDKIDETKIEPLRKYFSINIKQGLNEVELSKIISAYTCIITRSSTSVGKKIIENGDKLKIIARAGIGVDNIDIFEATKRGIAVINAPKGNARVTAEHTIGMMFALLRHIPNANQDLKRGIWGKSKYVGMKFYGKKWGIVGFGNVGKEVYRLAKGVGMKILICEPYVKLPKKIEKVTFEELLQRSDIITFHVPQTYLTKSMINQNTLKFCKNGVYIINCSRGAVVEEKAIIRGFKTGQVAGFAVDVFVKEPMVSIEILKSPNVVATPHIAGSTLESQRQSIVEVVNGILHYIKEVPPANLVNPQVFHKKKRKRKVSVYDAVIFDCDSTLTAIEGIDELAKMLGKKNEVSKLTKAAMDGSANFEQIYTKRFSLVAPSMQQLDELGKLYIKKLVEDAKEVISALNFLGKEVYIVSGGFSPALMHLGKYLGIRRENIFGNDLIHDKSGNYLKYVEGPLRRNHGKLQIIRQIPGKKLVVGDSITDLETIEYADLFVGYGGVVRRRQVEIKASIYLYHKSLTPVLVLGAGSENSLRLIKTPFGKYIGKGIDILSHPSHVKVAKNMSGILSEFKELAYYNGERVL